MSLQAKKKPAIGRQQIFAGNSLEFCSGPDDDEDDDDDWIDFDFGDYGAQ